MIDAGQVRAGKSHAVFVANRGYALTSSRTSLIGRFLDGGWLVTVVTADDAEARKLVAMGCGFEPIVVNRGGFSPASDARLWSRLRRVYLKLKPELIQHFHAKPVIFGSLAARVPVSGGTRVVNTITGLGHAFVSGGLAARLVGMGYRCGLPFSTRTVFQNPDDRRLFLDRGWLPESAAKLIVSSGVDTDRFGYVDRQARESEAPTIVMLGRLLRQKGIYEFIEVANRVQSRIPKARFVLAGEEDSSHADAVSASRIADQGCVDYVGRLSDVVPLLRKSDLLLFPSVYREGVPRAILEAAATGLPTVAFDVPGVREAVRHGQTGYLAKIHDVDELTGYTYKLLEDAALRISMGRAARELSEEQFDIRAIERQYVDVYREIGLAIA